MDDTLDSILAGSDDEAEEDAVISQVLDEIGIEVSSKVCNIKESTSELNTFYDELLFVQLSGVGVASKSLAGKEKADTETEDIEARLRKLHS